ncbi:hypothetical protein [Candidatus Spongiihabitans sp.]|uniref:hypothetical protein n=1 Tax=Candidatus Spongiihabitans sp. TaxID=3101308 RepID=UPI003C7BB32D
MDGRSANNVGNNYLPTAMDGRSANNVGNNYLPTAMDSGSANNVGNNYLPTAMDSGSADCRSCASRARGIHTIRGNIAGSKNLPKPQAQAKRQPRHRIISAAVAACASLDYRVKPDNNGGVAAGNFGGWRRGTSGGGGGELRGMTAALAGWIPPGECKSAAFDIKIGSRYFKV